MHDGTVIAQRLDTIMPHEVLDLAGITGQEAVTIMIDAVTVGISAQDARAIRLGVEGDGEQADIGGARQLGQRIAELFHAAGGGGAHAGDPAARKDEVQRERVTQEILLHDQTARLIPERHIWHELVRHARDHAPLIDRLAA